MELAQRHRVDEEQAVSKSQSVPVLYRDGHTRSTLLGPRDIRQFHLLQQHQPNIRTNSAFGNALPVSVTYIALHLETSVAS